MDSRLKRRAVFLAFSVILLILAAVCWLNRDAILAAGFFGVLPAQSETAAPSEMSVRRNASGQTENEAQTAAPQDTARQNGSATEQNSRGVLPDGMIEGSDLSAFMRDETFFDPEKSSYEKWKEALGQDDTAEDDTGVLTLNATSVQKDIRVQIVGDSGLPVTGETFFVTLSDTQRQESSYKDLDRDGVIYIGDLAAGDYFLTLEPADGYRVAAGSLKVTVKEKVEYKIIDDISLLIRTEDEIDAALEDTAKQDAADDADETENTGIRRSDGKTRFGIDVSKWNKEIDWARVKAAGVDFAVIRCGYRGSASGVLVEDPYFVKNIEGALANDVQVGVYFFTQATTEVEAVEEASMVISLCREYALTYPVFIDTEGAGGRGRADGLDRETRTLVCEAFCETIQNAGYDAGVYASRNWFYNQLTAKRLSGYITWLAEYRGSPLYTGEYQLWQYTSSGAVDGIEGRVDLNVSYLGY